MEKTMKVQKSSEMYRNIDELKLTATEHQKAVSAIAVAETLTAALDWLLKGKSPVSSGIPSNAKLKHQ